MDETKLNVNVVNVLEGCVYKWNQSSAALKYYYLRGKGTLPIVETWQVERGCVVHTVYPPLNFLAHICRSLNLLSIDYRGKTCLTKELPHPLILDKPHPRTLPKVSNPVSPPPEKLVILPIYIFPNILETTSLSSLNFTRSGQPLLTNVFHSRKSFH